MITSSVSGDARDKTARCVTCGRLGTDAFVQWHRPPIMEPQLRYCRHCWGAANAEHRAAFQAEVDAKHAAADLWSRGQGPMPPNDPGLGIGSCAHWIAGSGWFARLARRIFP